MKKVSQRIICVILTLALLVPMLPAGEVKATKNFSAKYVSDYRNWSQGQSAYSEMRAVGCLIVAQAKMLYEAGIDRSASFNPDTWYEWLWNNKCLYSPPSNLNMTNAKGAVTYAASKGKKLEYLGYWGASESQLWSYIKSGYYALVAVNGGGHWVMVDNQTSLKTGKIYVYNSYSRGSKNPVGWSETNQFTWNNSPHVYGYAATGAHVYKPSNAAVVKPSAPTGVTLNSSTIGLGDAVNVSWQASAGATAYQVNLVCKENSAYDQSKSVTGTSASFFINNPGTYNVTISASNSAGSSSAAASSVFTAKNNVTVTYVDWEGEVIGQPQIIKYGGSATAPTPPQREGYTFQGWSDTGKNVTADMTIQAQYQINKYSVSFVDYEGNVIDKVQKVEYGASAVPPTEVPAKEGYVFAGWSSEEYKEVKSALTIEAVYVWENANLPILTEITQAVRNDEATGYQITVHMQNFPEDFTKGKLVTALKTKEGKMVASETTSVSLPVSGELTEEITVLYPGLASTVEVSMIGVLDDDTTGTPKSKVTTSAIDIGNEWSDWSETLPEDENVVYESRTEYRYKDRQVIKATSKPAAPSGYTYEGFEATGTYTSWSAWSGYSTAAQTADTLKNVQTCTGYRYYGFKCKSCGKMDPYSGSCSACGASGLTWVESWGTCKGTAYGQGYTKVNSTRGKIYWMNEWWYFEFDGCSNGQGGYGQPTCTMYRYQTRQQYYNYTFWMTDYSDWQAEAVTASDSCQAETRTVYRFKTNSSEIPCYNYKRYKYTNVNNGKTVYTYTSVYADSMEYPGEWEYNKSFAPLTKVSTVDETIELYNGTGDKSWYRADVNDEGEMTVYETTQTLEDTTGTKRVVKGTMEEAAGKCATLLVYKGNNADPIASQIEYIAQTVIAEDGTYEFPYITKEEPTAKTGDFVLTLGVEGASNYINIGTIEAPKAVYTVDFVDDEGNLIGEQKNVVAGGTVEAPEVPEKEGYEFIGWDTGLRNIRENMVISAQYKKKTCIVIFADWDAASLAMKEFEYGDELTAEMIPEKAGQRFSQWLDENGNEVTVVTGNMVVTASYVDTKYVITFTDWDGNVISQQEVAYGEEAVIPEDLAAPNDGMVFAGWSEQEGLSYVTRSCSVTPVSKYTTTTEAPVFTVTTGTYATEKKVGIYSLSANTDIYYLVQPYLGEGATDYTSYEGFQLYTAPITVKESCVIYAYAASANANNSTIVESNICIETAKPSVEIKKPGRVSLKKVQNVKGRKAKLSWKKQTGISGYEIQCALNKKFTKKLKKFKVKSTAAKKVIKKLKKNKTYYFRVRAYVTADQQTVYGKWSKIRKVKIRK